MNNEKPLNTTTIIIADSDLRLYRPDLQTSMRSQLTLTVFSITWQKQQMTTSSFWSCTQKRRPESRDGGVMALAF